MIFLFSKQWWLKAYDVQYVYHTLGIILQRGSPCMKAMWSLALTLIEREIVFSVKLYCSLVQGWGVGGVCFAESAEWWLGMGPVPALWWKWAYPTHDHGGCGKGKEIKWCDLIKHCIPYPVILPFPSSPVLTSHFSSFPSPLYRCVQTDEDPNLGKMWFHGSLSREEVADLFEHREWQ